MQFILVGFTQEMESRVFTFEGVTSDWTRSEYTVRIDLALARRYGIRLQELPLLCRELLDRYGDGEERRAYSYAEEDMRVYADGCAAARDAAARKRKPTRKPSGNQIGAAWRLPQTL
jgi:hypothetical protein